MTDCNDHAGANICVSPQGSHVPRFSDSESKRQANQKHTFTPTHTQRHNRMVGNVARWDDALAKQDPDWKCTAQDREAWIASETAFAQASAHYV